MAGELKRLGHQFRRIGLFRGSTALVARHAAIGGLHMKISQPLVLLLGGVLSASGAGCSAVNAVVGEHRTASRNDQTPADRLIAVGRVFENQGRYDQAEVMYRKALKQKPGDAAIQQQLQSLADRRNGVLSDQNSVASAIARADRVSAPRGAVYRSATPAVAAAKPVPEKAFSAAPSTAELELTSRTAAPAEPNFVTPAIASAASLTKVFGQRKHGVTTEQILAVVDSPASHTDLLLRGLRQGSDVETQCLAATLLGDCDPSDLEIRSALTETRSQATDPHLLLAVSDSQIQRGEADVQTAECLIGLTRAASTDVRIQAASDLRHFAGTASEADCIQAITGLLDSDAAAVRAIAAVTLGDFAALDSPTTQRLMQLAESDRINSVREAARTALGRLEEARS